MNEREIILSVRGAPTADVVEAALRCGWLPARAPDEARVSKGPGDWRARLLATTVDSMVTWGSEDEPEASVSHYRGEVTTLSARWDPTRAPVFERLEALPFTAAVITSLYPEWDSLPESTIGYVAPVLSGLNSLGWLCAFRGAGHDRLVSRRWLESGPWRLHRRAGDLSIVEFHDPAADADTALAQARPGHKRMGIGPEGGYIQPAFVYTCPPRGFYERDTQRLKVVVHGRPLKSRELLEACAVRIETRPMEPGPIRSVGYVFMEEEEAQANLHELWARELECWTIRDGEEVRLDLDYRPTPTLPEWARG